jgi:hypothetical protein
MSQQQHLSGAFADLCPYVITDPRLRQALDACAKRGELGADHIGQPIHGSLVGAGRLAPDEAFEEVLQPKPLVDAVTEEPVDFSRHCGAVRRRGGSGVVIIPGMRSISVALALSCALTQAVSRVAAEQAPAGPAGTATQSASAAPAMTSPEGPPTEQQLGLPVYPGAQFIRSYDAGRGQRYYLFGASASYEQVVTYYRTLLKQRGDVVFERPATHMFEVGRYRSETMAFPPGVTVKDFTWGGSAGYPSSTQATQPARFPTIIQIVPAAF